MSAGTPTPGHGRREFLSRVGGSAAVAAALTGALPAPVAAHDDDDFQHFRDVHRVSQRARDAFEVRLKAALFQMRRGTSQHRSNGDELRYENKIGSFSKYLPHDANGEVDRAAFAALVHAMRTADPEDFELIPLGGTGKLVNPQAGFAFGFCGADAQASPVRVPPRFASAETAGEMVELYWAVLARDVPFDQYAIDPTIAAACAELSALSDFRGPKVGGAVTPGTIFRGPTAGDLIGPFISQLLWKPINYGPYVVDQLVRVTPPATADSNADYLWNYTEWLTVQNGGAPPRAQQFVGTTRRYIITARDLAEWLHRDFTHQGGTNAVFILMANGVGLAPGNPYLTSRTQVGNFTFGTAQILDLVASIANNALQACWFHKWSVDRKVRPEEFGGSLHNKLTLRLPRPIHRDVLDSVALARSRRSTGRRCCRRRTPKAALCTRPIRAGTRSSAGAWATILKAFFNTEAVIADPVVPDATGSTLVPYARAEAHRRQRDRQAGVERGRGPRRPVRGALAERLRPGDVPGRGVRHCRAAGHAAHVERVVRRLRVQEVRRDDGDDLDRDETGRRRAGSPASPVLWLAASD